jgi:cell division protein FtsL
MNPAEGHNMPYWWSGLLGFFSVLSLQDYVFIIGALISAFFTIKTYYAKRKEEKERMEEERKRTAIMENYLKAQMEKPESDRPAAIEVVSDAIKKAQVSHGDSRQTT